MLRSSISIGRNIASRQQPQNLRHPRRQRHCPSTLDRRRHASNSSNNSTGVEGKLWTLDNTTGIVSLNNNNGQPSPRRFQTIIGLEIHAQLDIPTKLFSPAWTTTSNTNTTNASPRPNDHVNGLVHPLDAAIPGYLPVLSRPAVEAALVAANVLHCHIPRTSRFERKHYVYADLPLGYQMTQQRWPLARHGSIQTAISRVPNVDACQKQKMKSNKNKNRNDGSSDSNSNNENTVTCRINRIQLEQDTGKTTTTTTTTNPQGQLVRMMLESSRVDLNRAGCALLEIVTEPDLRTPQQAACIVETIRQLLAHVQVCTGRMELGQLRVDLNVNIQELESDHRDTSDSDSDGAAADDTVTKPKRQHRQQRQYQRSPRVEVKNLNSIRQVQQAAEYEVLRQAREWQQSSSSSSLSLLHETRTWNASTKQTVLLRRKDEARDYRFLPEPDLPPLVLYPPPLPPHHEDQPHGHDDGDDYLFANPTAMQNYIQAMTPELPAVAVQRLVSHYGLSDYQARVITSDPPAIGFFDRAYASAMQQQALLNADDARRRHDDIAATTVANLVANYLCNDLFSLLKEYQHHRHQHHVYDDDNEEKSLFDDSMEGGTSSIQDSLVTAEQLGEVVALVLNGSISKTMAKNLLVILYQNAAAASNNTTSRSGDSMSSQLSVAQIAANHGLQLVSDPVQLREHVRQVLKNSDLVEARDLERYFTMDHKVQAKLLKFFTGQCMAASKGNAEPEALREALEHVLGQMQQERNEKIGD